MVSTRLYDCLLEVVKKRRSIRYFRPDPVPGEHITRIIEAARWAPSGFHTQPWEFVVVSKKEIRDRVAAALEQPIRPPGWKGDAASGLDAPVFIILLADWRAKVGLPDPVQGSQARLQNVYCSGLAGAFLLMHLAAASLGLASRWYSSAGSERTERRIKEIIGIPEYLSIYDMMCVGYAAIPPPPKPVRELDSLVHYDDCGADDFRTDDEVAAGAAATKEWCLSAH
jgi:nitroreductase